MSKSQGRASRAVDTSNTASDKENRRQKPSTSGEKKPRRVLGTINNSIPKSNSGKKENRCQEPSTSGDKKPRRVLGTINNNIPKKNSSDKENLPRGKTEKKPIERRPVEKSGKAIGPPPDPKIKIKTKTTAHIPPPQKPVQVPVQPTVRPKKKRNFVASLCFDVPAEDCHPVALAFRSEYKKKKEELAKYLFKYFNEEIFGGKLPHDTMLEWEPRFLIKAGICRTGTKVYKNKGIRVKYAKIRMSTKLLDTAYKLQSTLVHEMCHAAVWIIDNLPREVSDHGPRWQKWTEIAMKRFPELPLITRYHQYKMKAKFTYKCLACGHCIGRHSKSLDVKTKRCDRCNGELELLLNRTTRSGRLRSPIPIKEKPLTGFALYVKENFHKLSKDHGVNKPTEVMKLLAEQFSNLQTGK